MHPWRDLTGRRTTIEHPYSSPRHSGKVRLGAGQWQVKLRLRDDMLHSADTYDATDRRTPANGAAADVDSVGAYLTDEVFLYRVVDRVVTAAGELIELEDCYWLDAVQVPASDLAQRRLRVVTPS